MINIRTRAAQNSAHKTQIKLMMSLESKLEPKLFKEFQAQYRTAASSLSANAISNTKLKALLKKHYEETGDAFFKLVEDSLEQLLKGELRDAFWIAFNKWIKENVAEKIDLISKATKKRIKRIIKKATEAGKSNAEIAKQLREQEGFNRYRARMVARTETHNAATAAVDTAVNETGVKMNKVWAAVLDTRTRAAHIAVNRKVKPQGVPFNVGGRLMQHPGDPNGGPENVINCRCALMYQTVRG